MKTINSEENKRNKTKLGVLLFLFLVVFSIFYTIYRTKEIENKVDSRFTSYDSLFIETNSVVVDSVGDVIGEVYIYTTDKEIEEFYDDSLRRKTKLYYNLKNKKLKIKEKIK